MQAYQQRVVDEKVQLDDKLAKLNAFIAPTEPFQSLPQAERERLQRQRQLMEDYSAVLGERIATFE